MSPSHKLVAALGLSLSAGAANATISILPTAIVGNALVVSEGTFTEVYPGGPGFGSGAGVYGVELVGGRAGAQGKEIFVGKNTGIPGAANSLQHEITWGTDLRPFTLTWTPTGVAITISGTTYLSPASPDNVPLTANGNTLKIFVKGNATLNITEIDGTPIANILEANGSPFVGTMGGPLNTGVNSSNEKHFYSSDNWGGNGFTVNGTLTVLDGGGSGRGIYFKHGNYVPPAAIPEPASWALLIAGFGLVGTALRRRRGQRVTS
jgi:hypothetical protein